MLLKITLILLILLIQYIEGFERVIVVVESDATDLIFDNAGSSCCVYGNCSCPSLYNALANLTSNVLINITTDVELSSIISIGDLANITITGHNNPTMSCNKFGRLHFISCYNCTIEGITWEGCGARNISDDDDNIYPVLQFTNSSNVTIQHCSFQQSIGQAVVLSGMSGDVNINYCNFLYNKQYEGHGTAIHYSSNDMLISSPLKLMITGCSFFYNERAKSIVYFSHLSTNFKPCKYLKLQNSKFSQNNGVPMYLSNHDLHINGNIEFTYNIAENGGGIFISDHSNVIIHKSTTVNFVNNRATNNGGAIFLTNHSSILFDSYSTSYQCYDNKLFDTLDDQNIGSLFNFYNNTANGFGQDIYVFSSKVTVDDDVTVTFDSTNGWDNRMFLYSMYITDYSDITFKGTSRVSFDNLALYVSNSGAMYIDDHSIITIEGNSIVSFFRMVAITNNVGVMYIRDHSTIIFDGNSTVTFANKGSNTNGGAMYIHFHSAITFKGNSNVMFYGNAATNGGVMYVHDNSNVTFEGNSAITFSKNGVRGNGGVVYIVNNSAITFGGNSAVRFSNNQANTGGAIYIAFGSSIAFKGNSTVKFFRNNAGHAGVLYIISSTITFEEYSVVTFAYNYASSGGVMYISYGAVIFRGNSTVTFANNSADNGGAMYIDTLSAITLEGNCKITFYHNTGKNGGAMHIKDYSNIAFDGNSVVIFDSNNADYGGAMYIDDETAIIFEENCTVTSNNNEAGISGGAMYIYFFSTVTFEENSLVTFNNNKVSAGNGGAVYSDVSSAIIFEGNSTVIFNNNTSDVNGGALFIKRGSDIKFKGNSTVIFYNNKVDNNGGAFYIDHKSSAQYIENSTVTFNGNIADFGGSIFSKSLISFAGNSFANFSNNIALRDGGAIYCSDHSYLSHFNNSSISFSYNTANDYGGAIYVLFKESSINLNSSNIHFKENSARIIQNSVYINVLRSCDRNCLLHDISIYVDKNFKLATSPHKLILYNPAKCITGNDTDCDTYYMSNIMLGQDITFDACVHDYYDQPTEATQFVITGMNHQYYNITGSKYITISCNHTTQGITVTGNLHSNNSYNYSINISLYVTRISESRIISVDLMVELSQCHPGFWHSGELKKCECYDTKNIISCSGSNSTIKRGYWFGSVNGKSTVTFCPNDYCNFTCCEINNGIYHLSPVRANQCKPHRSGTACGSCEKGYSLSFDSPNCVEINKCTIGQTILVITLSLLYWIAVVVAVFVMMYFKVTVGSLYGIIYYYSVVDILLSQMLFISNGLYTTVNVMSSLAKLTPQFLGQLCLVQNMSGIDQQFIHYVHPTVISLILVMIIMLVRRSHRVSSFARRGIIHFICFLLLLSYTSVASTSLLLMRPLKFTNVEKTYTYLSPDIKYFNGRHLMYAITAIIFMVVIVIGFPLLLLLEPYLNSKINFIRIKPLLDQFQGCYKDKYRCFAGYYMVCRLVVILLVIVKIFDDLINQYILISSCALMQLIHVLVQPYISTFLNVFDGIILQLIVIISSLPVVEFVDNYDETYVLAITYLLVTMPLAAFIAMKLWFNKNNILNVLKDGKEKCFHKCRAPSTDNAEQPIEGNELVRSLIVDDNMRKNAIIVDV